MKVLLFPAMFVSADTIERKVDSIEISCWTIANKEDENFIPHKYRFSQRAHKSLLEVHSL